MNIVRESINEIKRGAADIMKTLGIGLESEHMVTQKIIKEMYDIHKQYPKSRYLDNDKRCAVIFDTRYLGPEHFYRSFSLNFNKIDMTIVFQKESVGEVRYVLEAKNIEFGRGYLFDRFSSVSEFFREMMIR